MATPSYLPGPSSASPELLHYEDSHMAEALPALYQLLCLAKDEAKKFRPGATLTLYADQQRLKACIHDRHTCQVWFYTLDGSELILEALDAALRDGKGEWRQKKTGR
jgi:hypothetical protein